MTCIHSHIDEAVAKLECKTSFFKKQTNKQTKNLYGPFVPTAWYFLSIALVPNGYSA